jgi:hypothetical protein
MIHNIHFLIDTDANWSEYEYRRAKVSRHVIMNKQGTKKWVFGWDPPLQSFYLQVHDLQLPVDNQIVAWLGADKHTILSEVKDLTQAATSHGLRIDHTHRVALNKEKEGG